MGVGEIIAVSAIALVIGGAIFYIIKSKKSGVKCIGCPHSKQCANKCNCSCKNKNEKD